MKLILEGWKKFLKESVLDQEEELEAAEGSPLAASSVPSELYYVTSEKYVWNVVEEGILDYKEPQSELEETRVPGVSFYTDYNEALKAATDRNGTMFVFDGDTIAASGQYGFSSVNGGNVRVIMRDEASESGNGASDMVDELGTRIPFKHVKGVLFPSMSKDKAAKFAERGLNAVKIGQYDPEGSDPKIIYAP